MKFGNGPSQIEVNIRTRAVLFRTLRARMENKTGFALATLNLDHLAKLPLEPAFAQAYRKHDLVIADGRPVVWLAQLAQQPIELMPGSDMIVPLCRLAAEMDVPIALLGSMDAALEGAGEKLMSWVPGLRVVYTHAPPYGFDPEGPQADQIYADLAQSGAGFCFIALGAPKQEIFAARGRDMAPTVGFVSIGAGLDFLSGHQVRAPRFMRSMALEWLWRLAQSPKRMGPRYARCFAILPRLVLASLRARQEQPSASQKT